MEEEREEGDLKDLRRQVEERRLRERVRGREGGRESRELGRLVRIGGNDV